MKTQLEEDWEDILSDFSESKEDHPAPDEILFYEYTYECYEGSAKGYYRRGDLYYAIGGSHCSCYGLEGQFDPEEYTLETFRGIMERYAELEILKLLEGR